MNDSGSQVIASVLDIVVIVTFAYLAMAFLSSVVAEVYALLSNRRARMLRAAIERLLDDADLTERLYQHPLIRGISRDVRGRTHLDSRLVSLALLDLMPNDPQQQGMLGILQRSCQKTDEDFQMAIEDWFNRAMNRLSRVYEKRTQRGLLAFCFVLVALFNMDTVQMVTGISRLNPDERSSLTATLNATLEETRPSSGMAQDVRDVWQQRWQECRGVDCGVGLGLVPTILPFKPPQTVLGWLGKATGWFLSALAASLGSQFWFRLLQLSWRLSGRAPLVPPPHIHRRD